MVKPQKRKRVFSGTRATGELHLGNYLGAIKGYLELARNPEYETIFMVMDLHALTTPYKKEKLAQNTKEVVLDYLACGLEPEKSIITVQSLVPEHTYLAQLLSSVVTVARMQHLPTYKEKIKQYPEAMTMALLNYPVLMAADILLYKAQLVPVGVDQEPHLEVAREIARKMNEKYGTDFPEPRRFATSGSYIPSLTGEGKMSKSIKGSYIGLTDSLEVIKRKLAAVPTDSGKGSVIKVGGGKSLGERKYLNESGQESKGVEILMQLTEIFLGEEKRREYELQYQATGIGYRDLKSFLAEAIFKELEPLQKKRREIEAKDDYIEKVITEGAVKARQIAEKTLAEVKAKMGLVK